MPFTFKCIVKEECVRKDKENGKSTVKPRLTSDALVKRCSGAETFNRYHCIQHKIYFKIRLDLIGGQIFLWPAVYMFTIIHLSAILNLE